MKNKIFLVGLFILISICFINCSSSLFSSDNFIGIWVQTADINTSEIKSNDVPIKLRISKHDIFYLVEVNRDGTFVPYPDKSGKYEISEDKKTLNSIAFGPKFSIQYRNNQGVIFENAWLGYFKKTDDN